ncbi:DUF541 domain-containing protein [Patescibacteria group bacterium]|nr:MAG: DUF541 domain-containing protein [Patescibacteria group bacterium]
MPNPSAPEPRSFWPRWDENRLFTVLVAIFLVYASVWLLTAIKNNAKQFEAIGKAPEEKRTIMIDGTGKVSATPTIARIQVGVLTEGETDIAAAQKQNTEKMNALVAALKAMGIAQADLQTTNYSIYPRYDYTNGKSILVGYTVSQNVNVKVRDLTKVSAVFQKAGELGANQVSGPDFTIDDPESLRAEARDKAISNATAKAADIAKALGVRIVRVVSFNESVGGGFPTPEFALKGDMGGAAPQIETGSLDVSANVSVTYEIK